MLLPGHLDNKVTRYNKTVSHTDKTVSHTAHIRQVQVLILFLCPALFIDHKYIVYLLTWNGSSSLLCKNNPTLSPFGAEKHPLSFSLTYAAAGLLE